VTVVDGTGGGGSVGGAIGVTTGGPGASHGAVTGIVVLVCAGATCPPSGGLGVYRKVAITRPRTTTARIVIRIPRSDMWSFNFATFVIHSTGARH
jgi:hypothetical protein